MSHLPMTKLELDNVNSIHNDPQMTELMSNLSYRWSNESQYYEDINDYATEIKKLLPHKVELLKMTKRPFGFTFKINQIEGVFKMTAGGSYSWKRTA